MANNDLKHELEDALTRIEVLEDATKELSKKRKPFITVPHFELVFRNWHALIVTLLMCLSTIFMTGFTYDVLGDCGTRVALFAIFGLVIATTGLYSVRLLITCCDYPDSKW